MRILILTPRLPWPPTDGGRVAMARLAVSLADVGATVEIVSLNPRKHRSVAQAPVPTQSVDIDTSRVFAPALRAMTSEVPYVVTRFISREYGHVVRATMHRFAPDVVQIESPFLLPYADVVRAASRARVVLRSANVEFRIWEGLARTERGGMRRLALQRVADSLRRYELARMNELDAIVPISDADQADLRSFGCSVPMHVVPCGVSVPDPSVDAPEPNRVGFIGSLDFLPNQQAVRWILDELWPRVLARAPDARLSIAGSSPPEWLLRRAVDGRVEILGQVDDAQAYMRRLAVVIAPLFAGGGMRIKVLEAMSLAKPIVATTIGAGGIDARDGRDILIADDVHSFAHAVAGLLRDSATATRLGASARATVAERYDNRVLARDLLEFYESL